MKKLSLTLLAAAFLISAGCKKKYCFECTTVTTLKRTTTAFGTTVVQQGQTTGTPVQICDKTDDEAEDYEQANSSGPVSSTQDSTVTETTTTTDCRR